MWLWLIKITTQYQVMMSMWQCKWRHRMTKLVTNASSATWWPKLEPMLIALHVGQKSQDYFKLLSVRKLIQVEMLYPGSVVPLAIFLLLPGEWKNRKWKSFSLVRPTQPKMKHNFFLKRSCFQKRSCFLVNKIMKLNPKKIATPTHSSQKTF